MPQITKATDQQLYGVSPNDNTMTFQERLMQYFQPHEFVTVKNVDDEPYMWQYMPANAEEHEYTSDPMKITRRGDPELWVINPGQQETIIGASAYIMIDGLYKKLVAKKRLAKAGVNDPRQEHEAINFSFADGEQQERWIKQIFIGKATPTFNIPSNAQEDLGAQNAAATKARELVAEAPKKD